MDAAVYLRSRTGLLLVVLLVSSVALGAVVLADLQSTMDPPRPTFIGRIAVRGHEGAFDAVTAVRGERAAAASCTVRAFDVYGQTVGTKVFDVGRLVPGEAFEWRGRVRVDARVERMSLDCR